MNKEMIELKKLAQLSRILFLVLRNYFYIQFFALSIFPFVGLVPTTKI